MIDEGYVKFRCERIDDEPPRGEVIDDLIFARKLLYKQGLIGVLPDGIGFGNVSVRIDSERFAITGTATGDLQDLKPEHIALVESCDVDKNFVLCRGLIDASSESMTHAAVYETEPAAKAVVHAHNSKMWITFFDKIPTTSPDAAYGTPEMAKEIRRLFRETDLRSKRIMVMGGHEDGILAFGESPQYAAKLMIDFQRCAVKLD